MLAAQAVEGRLKGLAAVHRVLTLATRTQEPLSDDELETAFTSSDTRTLGRLVRDLLAYLQAAGTPFPAVAIDALHATVQVRNHLAHGFLASNHMILDNPEAQSLLCERLAWWAEVFATWLPLLDRLAERLLTVLGVSLPDIAQEKQEGDRQFAEVRPELLARLREQVSAISNP